MHFRAFALPLVLVASTLASGCISRQGDFTVMSTKLVNLSEFELDSATRQRNVIARDISHIIIIFPTKMNPNIEEAVDAALLKGDGDVMTDVVLQRVGWYIPLIYGQVGWRVKGDVVKTRKN